MNDSPSDLVALKAAAERISPDRIQVNTVVRPPTLSEAHPLDAEELEKCRAFLGPKAELIVSFAKEEAGRENPGSEDSVIEMIRRRPCGLEEISAALNIPKSNARTHDGSARAERQSRPARTPWNFLLSIGMNSLGTPARGEMRRTLGGPSTKDQKNTMQSARNPLFQSTPCGRRCRLGERQRGCRESGRGRSFSRHLTGGISVEFTP